MLDEKKLNKELDNKLDDDLLDEVIGGISNPNAMTKDGLLNPNAKGKDAQINPVLTTNGLAQPFDKGLTSDIVIQKD